MDAVIFEEDIDEATKVAIERLKLPLEIDEKMSLK